MYTAAVYIDIVVDARFNVHIYLVEVFKAVFSGDAYMK